MALRLTLSHGNILKWTAEDRKDRKLTTSMISGILCGTQLLHKIHRHHTGHVLTVFQDNEIVEYYDMDDNIEFHIMYYDIENPSEYIPPYNTMSWWIRSTNNRYNDLYVDIDGDFVTGFQMACDAQMEDFRNYSFGYPIITDDDTIRDYVITGYDINSVYHVQETIAEVGPTYIGNTYEYGVYDKI